MAARAAIAAVIAGVDAVPGAAFAPGAAVSARAAVAAVGLDVGANFVTTCLRRDARRLAIVVDALAIHTC